MRPCNVVCAGAALLAATSVLAQEKDRGPGLPTSQPGIYVERGEVLFDVFAVYTKDSDYEYLPDDFGFPSPVGEFKGNNRTDGGVVLAAWGISDRFAVELRAAATKAKLDKAPEDTTGMPDTTEESGLGDVRTRLTWRWLRENEHHPELWLFEDLLLPHDSGNPLIGTSDLTAETGIGLSHGARWGTMTYRASFLYEPGSETHIDFGDIAIEYLKRVSRSVSLLGDLLLVQGDEYYVTGQVKWDLSPRVALSLLGKAGLSAAAVDTTAEGGIVFRFP